MYPKLDAYNLRLFEAIARAGSIAQAAREEHIAPSALSRRLAELESTLKSSLFVRSPRGLELTSAGKVLLQKAQRVNSEMQSLVRDMWSLSDSDEVRGVVRVWANPSALIGYLPEIIKTFSIAYPDVHIDITEEDTGKVIRGCLKDEADVGIAVAEQVQPGLDVWPLTPDPLRVVCPKGHPLLILENGVSLVDALKYPLISIRIGGSLDGLVRTYAKALDDEFQPRLTVSSIDAAFRFIEVGLGIAVLPASMLKPYAGVDQFVAKPLEEPWAVRMLNFYALRKHPRTPAVQAFLEHLGTAAQAFCEQERAVS